MNKRQKALIKYYKIKNPSSKKALEKAERLFDKGSDYETYKANEFILLETEKKKYDYLYCNEVGRLGKNESIFDYKNLYVWDKSWWKYQKNSLTGVNTDKKYRDWYRVNYAKYRSLYMQGDWYRWIEKEQFQKKPHMVYGSIEGLNNYVKIKIEERLESTIDKIIPNNFYHEYRTPLFIKEKGSKYSTMADTEVRAGGFEKELEQVRKIKRESFHLFEEIIYKEITPFSNYTFTKWEYPDYKTTEKIEDGIKLMIVGGFKAAKKISFKTFLDDFYKLEQPIGLVDNLIEEIYEFVEELFLKKCMQDKKLNKIIKKNGLLK